jgi:hypothetical protein
MIEIGGATPLVVGGKSRVYKHPADETLLVKILRPEALERGLKRATFWRGRRRRYFHLLNYCRSIEEHAAVLAAGRQHPPHLERVVGLAETDLGIGLVVRGEFYRGALAPSLRSIMKAGKVTEEIIEKLDEFFEWLLDSPIIVNDMKPINLVLSQGRDGRERFVLIDGYGETAAIPVKSWFPALNRYAKRRKAEKLRLLLRQQLAVPLPELECGLVSSAA